MLGSEFFFFFFGGDNVDDSNKEILLTLFFFTKYRLKLFTNNKFVSFFFKVKNEFVSYL